MQRFLFFLLMVLSLYSCQNARDAKEEAALQKLLSNYRRLPGYAQDLDLSEFLFLKPAAQKTKLMQALAIAKRRQGFDSLYFDFLKEPYIDCQNGVSASKFFQPGMDSFLLIIRHTAALSSVSQVYRVTANQVVYKKINVDHSCNPLTGPKSFTVDCLKLLSMQEKNVSSGRVSMIGNYLNECDFYGFPSKFNNGCFDGDGITVFFKDRSMEKRVSASCPNKMHPLRILLNQVKQLLGE